ncbi:MAG: glycosyltransferase [Pseudomonadota bacterium]
MIKKIALLVPFREKYNSNIEILTSLFKSKNINTRLFYTSDAIDTFEPDCVLALSPQDAKLTRFPTYGFIDKTVNEYLGLPRFIRNLLTYDGYITNLPENIQMLEDLLFGARKLNSLITPISQLEKMHAETLINKGYIPNPNENPVNLPSITYIVRTGGRHRKLLERALNSLIAQNYPKLHVVFCIYKDFDFLDEILQQYPALNIQIIKREKSIRSTAICDGLATVKTDLFGLFDDDDELFPNHIRSLIHTLKYHHNRDWRKEIGMVYSGSIIIDDQNEVYENTEYRDMKLANRHERRVIEHFRFYRPEEMSQHNWFMMSNAWLAKSSLIDSELLTDPRIDTCEDLYFELLIAQRTHFAFSAEVTCVHHFQHSGPAINSTIVDSKKHIPDTQRIALRNFSRSFANSLVYDTHFNQVGRPSPHLHYTNPFYPERTPKRSLSSTYRKFIINLKYFGLRKALRKLSAKLSGK